MAAATPADWVLYLRKSKGRAGIARQRTITTAHIERQGGAVVAEYVDADRTAYRQIGAERPQREDFDRMLAELPARPGVGIAAWHADRLLRDPGDTEHLIRACAAGRHLVETPSGGSYDLATATGRKRLRNDAIDAAYEVDHLTERVTAMKLEAADAGRWLGGRRPFGYESDGITVRLGEAQAVREGSRDVTDGIPLREVTRHWNAAGIRTSTGRAWTPREVSRVLRRPRNAALMEHQGKIVPGVQAEWPAIVDEAIWRSVCLVLGDPDRRTTPGPERRYLLSGIARCGICGTGLFGTATGGKGREPRFVYRCRADGGGGRHIARDLAILDAWITEVAIARLSRDDVEFPSRTPDTSLIRAELTAARGELDELARQAGARTITVRQMALASGPLQEQIADLQDQLAAAERVSLLSVFDDTDAAQAWEKLSLHQRRAVIAELMSVTVHPAGKGRPAGWQPGMSYFRPESVTIGWREPH